MARIDRIIARRTEAPRVITKSLGDADQGETLGHAFRLFMTQDVSDPDAERLIRERSGK